jgi:hypothetical protein
MYVAILEHGKMGGLAEKGVFEPGKRVGDDEIKAPDILGVAVIHGEKQRSRRIPRSHQRFLRIRPQFI